MFVFAKPPRPGLAKQRLAAALGERFAADFARASLEDTVAALRAWGRGRLWLATTEPGAPELAELGLDEVDQGQGSLGDRLERVLGAGLVDHAVAVALGGDAPDLPLALVDAAVEACSAADLAFVAARDGGFAAMAARRMVNGWLEGVPWSTDGTLTETLAAAARRGLTTSVVGSWEDVDVPQDLDRLALRLATGTAAPRTRALLGARR